MGYSNYLDCGDGFMVYTHAKFFKLYTLNICSLLYVKYTVIKILKSKYKRCDMDPV